MLVLATISRGIVGPALVKDRGLFKAISKLSSELAAQYRQSGWISGILRVEVQFMAGRVG